jgi:hypothetical protein
MSERVSDADGRVIANSSKSPRAASDDAEPSPSRAATSWHSDEDSVASTELVPDAVVIDDEEEEEEDAVAPWIRANFPSVKNERDEEALRLSCGFATAVCDECAARHATVSCVDCAQALCWRCADAIHIVRAWLELLAGGCEAIIDAMAVSDRSLSLQHTPFDWWSLRSKTMPVTNPAWPIPLTPWRWMLTANT